MKSVLIRNIKSLAGIYNPGTAPICGAAMKTLPSLNDSFLLIENGTHPFFREKMKMPRSVPMK
jgi:hypothetical protein